MSNLWDDNKHLNAVNQRFQTILDRPLQSFTVLRVLRFRSMHWKILVTLFSCDNQNSFKSFKTSNRKLVNKVNQFFKARLSYPRLDGSILPLGAGNLKRLNVSWRIDENFWMCLTSLSSDFLGSWRAQSKWAEENVISFYFLDISLSPFILDRTAFSFPTLQTTSGLLQKVTTKNGIQKHQGTSIQRYVSFNSWPAMEWI